MYNLDPKNHISSKFNLSVLGVFKQPYFLIFVSSLLHKEKEKAAKKSPECHNCIRIAYSPFCSFDALRESKGRRCDQEVG